MQITKTLANDLIFKSNFSEAIIPKKKVFPEADYPALRVSKEV
jgi:hypothetical protein